MSFPPDRIAVARVFARRLGERDAVAAAVIRRQADRLERDDEDARAAEAEALELMEGSPWFAEDELTENVLVLPDGPGVHLWAYDDDALSIVGKLRDAPWLLSTTLVRALNDAGARSVLQQAASLHLLLFGPLDRVAEALDAFDARQRVTSLTLRPQHGGPPPLLAEALPALRVLHAPMDAVAQSLGDGHAALEALVVDDVIEYRSPPSRALSLLRTLEKAPLPSLCHLAVRHGQMDAAILATVARSEPVARCVTLDLSTTNYADHFPFDALLAERARLAHLERIVVGGHLVSARVRRRFADWPEVTFVSHDRRELLAFDLALTGWPWGSR